MTSFLVRAARVLRHWRSLACAAVLACGYLYAAFCLNTAGRMVAELHYINGFTVAAPVQMLTGQEAAVDFQPDFSGPCSMELELDYGVRIDKKTRLPNASLLAQCLERETGRVLVSEQIPPRIGIGFPGSNASITLGHFACEKGRGYHATLRVLRAAESLSALRPRLVVGDDLSEYSQTGLSALLTRYVGNGLLIILTAALAVWIVVWMVRRRARRRTAGKEGCASS